MPRHACPPGADGKLPVVGNTEDVANATWTNGIGAPKLIACWSNPDFNPSQPAVCCVRVIEIPTPRRTAHVARRFRVRLDDNVAMVTAECAKTSPIWYTPEPG